MPSRNTAHFNILQNLYSINKQLTSQFRTIRLTLILLIWIILSIQKRIRKLCHLEFICSETNTHVYVDFICKHNTHVWPVTITLICYSSCQGIKLMSYGNKMSVRHDKLCKWWMNIFTLTNRHLILQSMQMIIRDNKCDLFTLCTTEPCVYKRMRRMTVTVKGTQMFKKHNKSSQTNKMGYTFNFE